MTVELILERLVKRDGMYMDKESGRRGVAQYVGYYQAEGSDRTKLVLLTQAPSVRIRELTVDRDGNLHLEPEVLDEIRVVAGKITYSVECFNERKEAKGRIVDVLIL